MLILVKCEYFNYVKIIYFYRIALFFNNSKKELPIKIIIQYLLISKFDLN